MLAFLRSRRLKKLTIIMWVSLGRSDSLATEPILVGKPDCAKKPLSSTRRMTLDEGLARARTGTPGTIRYEAGLAEYDGVEGVRDQDKHFAEDQTQTQTHVSD